MEDLSLYLGVDVDYTLFSMFACALYEEGPGGRSRIGMPFGASCSSVNAVHFRPRPNGCFRARCSIAAPQGSHAQNTGQP